MRKNVSRGRLIFTCVWLGIFALAYILWAFYLTAVSNRLVEYEKTRPENEAERVFTDYFLNADPMAFSSYDDVESKYDVRGAAKKFYYDLTYGKRLAFSKHGSAAGIITYSVTADGEEFARFALSADEEGTWELSKIVLTAVPPRELYIRAPRSALVTVNGVLIDGERAVSEYMLAESPVFEGEADKRAMVVYYLTGLFGDPKISVKLTDADVELGLDNEGESNFSAERTYISYLSYLYYGNN